jgi:uncharacterized protein (DUF169 family)
MSWAEISSELVNSLRLRTDPIAFRRLEKAADLDKIKNVQRIPHLFTLCQAFFLVRVQKLTVGVTKEDKMNIRCMRLHGVRHASEKSMQAEAQMFSTTWFASPEEAYQQQMDSPRVPVAEAIIMAPLSKDKIEPEVVLLFGNPAQIMMLLCGLQKEKYGVSIFILSAKGPAPTPSANATGRGNPSSPSLAMGRGLWDR